MLKVALFIVWHLTEHKAAPHSTRPVCQWHQHRRQSGKQSHFRSIYNPASLMTILDGPGFPLGKCGAGQCDREDLNLPVICYSFQETRCMPRVTTSQESHLNLKLFNVFNKNVFFWAEMPSGTCELSCALITNLYAICNYEYNC